jgi:hypothetical protein
LSDLRFYLGTHRPTWLWTVEEDVPLFISHRVLATRRTPFPRATTDWALDSGGFTELNLFGCWQTTPEEYVAAVRRYVDELGRLQWASPQDWMCEPWVVEKTCLSVEEHQRRTVENYLELKALAPDLPFIPVLQGWQLDDYRRHADAYVAAGVDLTAEPTVGVGSVCRRQASGQITWILESLRGLGLRMHGFGVKIEGLEQYADSLVSADSLAWSYWARRDATKGIRHCTKNTCANCLHYALAWRERVLKSIESRQPSLVGGVA